MNKNLSAKKLFLIDAIGALVSSFMLGVVLVKLQHLVGLPTNTLYLLAGLPIMFFAFSITCYLTNANNKFLKVIAVANILYCCLTAILLLFHFQKLETLGIVYFVVEIIIVVALSIIEIKAATK